MIRPRSILAPLLRMDPASTELRRRHTLLLRWTLFASLLAVGATAPQRLLDVLHIHLILGFLLAVNVLLTLLPSRAHEGTPLQFSLGLIDTTLISFVMFRADPSGRLCLFFFVLLTVTAATTRLLQVLGAALSLGMAYILTQPGAVHGSSYTVMPLFFAAALHFGYQVLGAREHDRHAGIIAKERQEVGVILRILEAVTSSLDFQKVMFELVSRIADSLDAARCSVVLVERQAEQDRGFVVAASDNQAIRMLPIDLHRYPELLHAIHDRRPVVIDDIETSPLLQPILEDLRRLNFRSLVVVPIIYREEILGTLFLRATRRRTFTPDELQLCRGVASAAAGAVKNSMLYSSLEQRAREQEAVAARLKSLFDHSPDLILRLDGTGHVAEVNQRVARVTGMPLHAISGRHVSELLTGLPDVPEMVRRATSSSTPVVLEAALLRPTTTDGLLSVTVGSLGETDGVILIARDVTEERLVNARRHQQEKLSGIGEIVAKVAHELSNPLSGVIGFAQLLLQEKVTSSMQRQVERILECSTRCQKIVRNLLAFARPDDQDHKSLGINGLIRKTLDVLEPSGPADGIEVRTELEADLPYVLADFHRMQQVLTNLIMNARQALAERGGPGRITIRTRAEGEKVVVDVIDDGPGIAPEILPRIFDPFFSTKAHGKGTGLGLSISYGIVRDHQGELLVDSLPGQGSTFSVILPAAAEPVAQEASSATRHEVASSGRTILAVDDEATILDLYLEVLRSLGHAVDTASSGIEALRKIRERDYDLVVSDIKMPKLSGVQLYEKVREFKPEVARRFIFITGDVNFLSEPQSSTIRQIPCLIKPVNIETIEATIRERLAEA